MDIEITKKLAALGLALMMNSLIIGGVAYLFNGQNHQQTSVAVLANTAERAQTFC